MKIDSYDNTLVCEKEDLQTVLSYFKDKREVPDYIEKSALNIIMENLYGQSICFQNVDEYLMHLPATFIQKTIIDINSMFSVNPRVTYEEKYLAYLLYYLPANIFKIWKPLLDLQLRNTLKPDMRILDIGTGPGSVPIGIIEFYRSLAESFPDIRFNLVFVLIDAKQEFLNIAIKMIQSTEEIVPKNLFVNIESAICKRVCKDDNYGYLGKFDLITMSNFLTSNEGENQKNSVAIISNFKYNMNIHSSLIIIEPGEQNSCKALKETRNIIVNSKILNLFSPCIGIWEPKDTYNCSCFNMVRCYWETPKIYKYLVLKGLNKAKRVDVPFNYAIFRADNMKKYPITKNSQYYVMLKDLKEKDGQLVNVKAIIRTVIYKTDKVSFSLCDGSCSFSSDENSVWVDVYNEYLINSGINIPLIAAERITLKKVLVNLHNDGINLMIGQGTRITVDY